MRKRVLSAILFIIVFNHIAFAQYQEFRLDAISSDPAKGKSFILLSWPHMTGIKGYNIYRKSSEKAAYSNLPVNSKPVSAINDCNEIKAIIPVSSVEWKALIDALSQQAEMTLPVLPSGNPKQPALSQQGTQTVTHLFDPCDVASITETDTARFAQLLGLAGRYYKIAQVIGQSYVDTQVSADTTYWYKIHGVNADQTEGKALAKDVKVTAGTLVPIPPPVVFAEAGDHQVLLTWQANKKIAPAAYDIERRVFNKTASLRICDFETVSLYYKTLKGNTLNPPLNGFLDYQRWHSTTGNPVSYKVGTVSIDGPENNVKYEYRVRGWDRLIQKGNWSVWVSATPADATAPREPTNVTVQAYKDTLEIRWFRVTRDVMGHPEPKIKGYQVVRYDSADGMKGMKIGGLVKHPKDTTVTYISRKDGASILRPVYGVRNFWYRVQCFDQAGNAGSFSAAVAGHLEDITPPAPPVHLVAIGDSNCIRLDWAGNSEPDLAGYMIYRGICGGEYVVVGDDTVYQMYPIHPIANLDNPDSIMYTDNKVSLTSPICYRYAVKAYDKSQNLSDTSRTVCERIQEKMPPPPPVISALKARSGAIRVEWVAPPVQDLFGFIVERSKTGSKPWKQISPDLKFPKGVVCKDIPATNIWAADSIFFFSDTTVSAKETYWYRIKGADYGSNVGNPSAPIETYTFDYADLPRPVITGIQEIKKPRGLKIEWKPVFDTQYQGFILFRSLSQGAGYRQISPFVKGNTLIDNKVMAGKTYWYKIQYFSKEGHRSPVSVQKSGSTIH